MIDDKLFQTAVAAAKSQRDEGLQKAIDEVSGLAKGRSVVEIAEELGLGKTARDFLAEYSGKAELVKTEERDMSWLASYRRPSDIHGDAINDLASAVDMLVEGFDVMIDGPAQDAVH